MRCLKTWKPLLVMAPVLFVLVWVSAPLSSRTTQDEWLYQAHYWVADTRCGSFGLEEWRGPCGPATTIYFGPQHLEVGFPAPVVAAAGFAGLLLLGSLVLGAWQVLIRPSNYGPPTT
jgi:hypothetical protein